MRGFIAAAVFAVALSNAPIASAATPDETLVQANEMVAEFNRARPELKSDDAAVRAAAWTRLSGMYQNLQDSADLENIADESQAALIQFRLSSLSNFLADWQYVNS